MYQVYIFLSFEDWLLGLIGGSKKFSAWEFWQYYVKFELVDDFLNLIMDVLKLTVS